MIFIPCSRVKEERREADKHTRITLIWDLPPPFPGELCSFIKYAIKRYPWLWREKYIFDLAFVATLCVSLYCVFFLSACNCSLSSSTKFQDLWYPAKSFNLGQNLLRHTTKTFIFFLSSWQKWKLSPNECPFLLPLPFSNSREL